jgi:hypothetical protein
MARATTDGCMSIDVRDWHREGLLRAGNCFAHFLTWMGGADGRDRSSRRSRLRRADVPAKEFWRRVRTMDRSACPDHVDTVRAWREATLVSL